MKKKDKIKTSLDRSFIQKMFDRFTKIIVSITIIYSMALTTISYIWSYLGKDPLVNLSSTIVSTLVAPVITYLVTNMVQVIFEKNQLSFSTPITAIQTGVVSNITNSTYSSFPEEYNNFSSNTEMVNDNLDSFEFDGCSGLGEDET